MTTARFVDTDGGASGSWPRLDVPSGSSRAPVGGGNVFTVTFQAQIAAADRRVGVLWITAALLGDEIRVYTVASGAIRLENWDGYLGDSDTSTELMRDDVWENIAIRKTSDTLIEVLLNGVVVCSGTSDMADQSTGTALQAFGGRGIYASDGMQGQIANVCNYDRALSTAEIVRQHRQSKPASVDCIGCWPLNENIGSSYLDGLVGASLTVPNSSTASATGPRTKWRNGPSVQAVVAGVAAEEGGGGDVSHTRLAIGMGLGI